MKKEDFAQRVETCFRGNDMRGIYDKEFDGEMAYKTGRAVVIFFKSKTIIVGMDMRYSSPILKKSLIKGIIESGCDVIDIGMIDTPGLYFASAFLKLPAVCITASHNPIAYNGIKFVQTAAVPVNMGNGLEKIKELVLKNDFNNLVKKGRIIKKDIREDYRNHVLSFINLRQLKHTKKLKVVIDAGNGVAGMIVPFIYHSLPLDLSPLYFEITGKFEHHDANPLKEENTKDLREKVVKERADLGITFDGDMDRVFFIDEQGKQLEASAIAALLITQFSKEIKPHGFVYSSTMSEYLPELANELKIEGYKEKVGHSFIKNRMRKEDAFFGCEDSGHFFYKKNFYADSGIITSLIVLEIFSRAKKEGKKFSDLFKEFQKYVKLKEESYHIKDTEHAYERILEHFKRLKQKKIDDFDGLTFTFSDYWFNVRFSKTEPVLRLNLEADSEKIMQEKSEEIGRFLKSL